jgi:ubiquinone/menaquinone biosynthesis C-methylase UbiE
VKDYIQITIDTYNKTAKEYAEKVKGLIPTIEFEKFVKYVPHGKILDIGCGSGVGARNLQEKGLQVYGIDLSKELLKVSEKESPNSKFYKMDMRKLKFEDNYFDGIWQMASLIHLEKKDVSTALYEANRVLKFKGIIYVPVKMGEGEGLEKDERYYNKLKYYAYYQPDEIERLLTDANFEVLENYWIKYDDSYRNAHPWINLFARKR